MEKNLEGWERIAELIALDKQAALAEFGRRPSLPAEPVMAQPEPLFRRRPLLLLAASLLLAAGLVSLWLLRGSRQSSPPGSDGSALLAGSFLYAATGDAKAESFGAGVSSVSPYFTAWAAAALQGSATDEAATNRTADPGAIVEHGDPEKVRRAIGRAIRENAFERMLNCVQEFHDQEA